MKTIVVPTDFSDISENAASYAAGLAKFSGATMLLMNTYSLHAPFLENPVAELQIPEMEKINKGLLKFLDKRLRATYGDLDTEMHTRIGFTVEEILALSGEKKADLIVMGISGASNSQALGSNTLSVLTESKCPVLVIPDRVKFKKPVKVALACDYTSNVPDDVVNKFKSFVKLFNAKVMVFDVLKTAELVTQEKYLAEENLEESLSDIEHTLHFPSGDDINEEMSNFVRSNKVDILAMIPHKHNFFYTLFHRGNTKEMALHSQVPLLAIHE